MESYRKSTAHFKKCKITDNLILLFSIMDMLLHVPMGTLPTVKAISITLKPKNAGNIPWEIPEELFHIFVVDVMGLFAILLFWKK